MKLLTRFFLGLTTLFFVACNVSPETTAPPTTQEHSSTVKTDSSTLKIVANNTSPNSFTGIYTFGDQEGSEGGGYLAIEEQGNDSLKFELDINIGAPNYNSGTATGILKLENNIAIFNTNEYSEEEPCTITFTFNNDNSIQITQNEGSSFSCGFGNRVFANGLYTKKQDKAIFKYEGGH